MSKNEMINKEQNESVSTNIRKGNYGKGLNYNKVSKTVMNKCLEFESMINEMDGYDLVEDKWMDYITYNVMRRKVNETNINNTKRKREVMSQYGGKYNEFPKITMKTHTNVIYVTIRPMRTRPYVKFVFQDGRVFSPFLDLITINSIDTENNFKENVKGLLTKDFGYDCFSIIQHFEGYDRMSSGLDEDGKIVQYLTSSNSDDKMIITKETMKGVEI